MIIKVAAKNAKIHDEGKRGHTINLILEAARQKGEVAFGYKLKRYETDADKSYGVIINPGKSGEVNFPEEDRVIVLAES